MNVKTEQNAMLLHLLKALKQSVKEGRFFEKCELEVINKPLLKVNGSKEEDGRLYQMKFDIKGIEKVKRMLVEFYVMVEPEKQLIEKI